MNAARQFVGSGLRRKRFWNCLASVLLLAALALNAQQTSPSQPPPPSSPPPPSPHSATSATESPRPTLPKELGEQISRDEKAVAGAISHPNDLESLRREIPVAEHVLSVREAQQGKTWWESIDARLQLADLRQFVAMPAEQRARLDEVFRANEQASALEKAYKLDSAAELQLKNEESLKEILGENHRFYADSLSSLGNIYEAMGHYEQAVDPCQKALDIRRQTFGEQHPTYARSLNDRGRLYQLLDDYHTAESTYQQALDIEKATLGEETVEYAVTLDNLASVTVKMGQDPQAEALYKRTLEIERTVVGERDPLYAMSLCNLGDLYRLMGHFPQALSLQQQSLEIRKKTLGEEHPDYARSLDRLAAAYDSMGKYKLAEPLYQRALAIREKVLGEEHPDYARSLNNLALLYKETGRYEDAEPLFEKALEIRGKVFGVQGRTYASSLDDLAQLDQVLAKYADAEKLYKQALEIRKNTVGEEHPAYAVNLDNLASLYETMSDYSDAEKLYKQALATREKTVGKEHPGYGRNLADLAHLYQTMGKYDQAEALYKQALEILKKVSNGDNVDYAATLENMASLDVATGRDEQAEGIYKQVLEIEKRVVGDQHPMYATTLCDLGDLYRLMARFAQAEPLYVQSREIRRKALGEDHPDYARSLDRLAALYDSTGRLKEAEPLFRQAIAIRKKALGDDHPDYARSLNNLAFLDKELGQYAEAEQLYKEALAIRGKVFGPHHRVYASSLDDLAQLYQATGKYQLAEPLYLQALQIRKDTLGEMHPAYAVNLDNLATLYEMMRRYGDAERLSRQALAIRKIAIGEQHPAYAANLKHLALILAATNRTHEASQLLLESAQLQWQHLTDNFPTMSDQQKKEFLSHSRFDQSEELSGLVFDGKGADPKDGLRGVLLSKELLFEVARQESGALLAAVASAPPEWQESWHERERLRHEYANLALRSMSEGGGHSPSSAGGANDTSPEHLLGLERQIEQLEEQLRRTNPAYATQASLPRVRLEDVSAALRPGEALLEYVKYRPYDFASRKWQPAHYGVFVLHGGAGEVEAVDLGSSDAIDNVVEAFRAKMIDSINAFGVITPSRGQVHRSENGIAQASSALRTLIWQPVEGRLAGVKRVYVAPDGMLSLIPFEALAHQDSEGGWRYLAEERELIYLGTGRDLGRLALQAESKSQPKLSRTAVLVSDPNFSADQRMLAAIVSGVKLSTATIINGRTGVPLAPKPPPAASSSSTLGGTASGGKRLALPATWEQGPVDDLDHRLTQPVRAEFKRLGWSVTMMSGDSAVEEAVLGVQSPRILQFATHGFVLDRPEADLQSWDNPLLRSGMVMAGVNTWPAHHAVYYHVGKEIFTEAQAHAHGLSNVQLAADRVEVSDGILTAYEVTGMNLQNTQLVNMTACETGLGEVTPDGVAGLRQAFLLAGARSMTMSMWEVPAQETAEEISDFYSRWLGEGKGPRTETRYEAFHAAQLAALKRARENYGAGHPFYWAGVVYVGDPGDLPSSLSPVTTAAQK